MNYTSKNALKLTEREFKILCMIAYGFNNNEIASKLFVSVNTVKSAITVIFKKLDVKNRAQAAYIAGVNGLFNQEEQPAVI